jgi:hypothetical protein
MVIVTSKTRTLVNGTANDASPVESNFTELYNNDATLASAVTALENSAGLQGYIRGLTVSYVSASSVQVGVGQCRNSTNTQLITIGTPLTVAITSAGAGGLDAGTEANNTWYYVYVIKKSSDASISALISTVNEQASGTITLPSGYDVKRQLPVALRNDAAGNFVPFFMTGAYDRPYILYQGSQTNISGIGALNILNSSSVDNFASVGLSGLLPPLSRVVLLRSTLVGGGGGAMAFRFRTPGETHEGVEHYGGAGSAMGLELITNTSQQIEYYRNLGTGTLSLDVMGYRITEI